jgi:NTP pyrophosphatase (non-canonical NTP hydrolase)
MMDYRRFVAAQSASEYPQEQHALMGMASELGEIFDYVKKRDVYGISLHPENGGPLEECGDLLFYFVMFLNHHGLTLEHVMCHNMEKLKKRYPDGFTKEDAALRKDKE